MCGFVGYVALTNQEAIDVNLFAKMNDVIAHRGPDGEGFAFFGNYDIKAVNQLQETRKEALVFYQKSKRTLALAHRRLSIIDLSVAAAQPMQSIDKNISLLFNGEIYNHAEIRKELVAKGHQFKTDHSDTETIIYAFKEWGIDCVKRFKGMYSIALWDEEADTLWLIRDKIGIKPLYFTQQNNKLYFASEIKSIIEDKTIVRSINHEGMFNYLSFLTVPSPQTLFENIYKIPPGNYLKIKGGEVGELTQYWDVFDNVKMSDADEEKIKEDLVRELQESVEYRGVADIPVGVFLSGGVDSSLNAALFSKAAKYPVKAFSVGYKDDDKLKSYSNEFVYAEQAAKDAGCEYYQQELTQQDFIDFLPKLIHHQDEPIGDPVCMPVYYVSKLAKEHNVTVCQVGEGSDELFWGYSSWKYLLKLQNLNDLKFIPNGFKKIGLGMLKILGKEDTEYYEWLKRGIAKRKIFWGGIEGFSETQKDKILTDKFKKIIPTDYTSWNVINKYYQDFLKRAPQTTNLDWMTYLDLKLRLPELLLMRVDKMSMAVSLEARVPFLDHDFVTHAMGIPAKLKTKNNVSKYILKKAVEGIIPHNIIYRKKQGFGAPVYDWMMDDLGEIAKEKIKLFCDVTGYVNMDYVDIVFKRKNGKQIWYLLNLALWWEYYIYDKAK